MQITIFGASGNIGRLLVKQGLEEGYRVKAYVRNPSKITFSHPNLEVIQGQLSDTKEIRKAIVGSEAVISTLGPSMSVKAKGYPVLEGHINIIKAMELEGITRFITLATPSVKFEKDQKSIVTVMPTIMAKTFLPRAYKEIVEIGEVVKSSKLDWTIVRIIAPNNNAKTGRVNISFGNEKIKFGVSRGDIAGFMLNQTKDLKYIHSMPIIGS